MSQTKFVLGKALAAHKKAIVVLNKIDRDGHRYVCMHVSMYVNIYIDRYDVYVCLHACMYV